MPEITAGAVSLDLVIKDTLEKQLTGIKTRVENMFGKATEQASSRAQTAIDNVAGSAENATKKVKDIAKGFDVGKVEKNIAKMTTALASASDDIRRMSNYLYSYLESFYRFFSMWNGAKNIEPLDPIAPQAAENAGKAAEQTEKVVEETEEVVEQTNQASQSTDDLTKKTSKLGSTASSVGKIVKKVFGTAFKAPLYAGGKALDALRSKFKGVAASVNETTKPVSRLFKSIKNITRKAFLIAGIAAAVKGLRSALGEAANSNQEFSDSLESIKFNLAVAFQPIITAVMPMLNTLMSGIASVTEKIAAFTNALFGTTYKKSAQAVAKSKQAAAAAKQAGKEAKNASKYLADYDEMRVHQDNSESSSSGGSGSGDTDYSKYEKDVKLGGWAEKLKDAFKTGDWNGAGKLVAEKINGVFGRIKWDKIREKVKKGARKAAEGINGFVDNLNWRGIGNSIGDGITTAFTAAYTFLKTTKWKSIGSGFAEFLNGLMEKTDFSLVGETLGAKLNAIIGLALGFVSTFNFGEAGTSFADVINGWFNEVNWEDIGDMLGTSIQGVIDFAFNFVDRFDEKKAAESFSTAFNKAVHKIDTKKLGKTVSDAFCKVWNFIATALEEIDWEEVGKKIGDFISGINWGEILESIFKVIGGVLKATPKLLLGLVESLDFEGAAGLFGVLFAPKMASSLLSKFTGDTGVISKLSQTGSTIGSKIASKASAEGHSFGTTFAAGVTAFCVGWEIGSFLYNTFQEEFDWCGEKLGKIFCKSLNKEVEEAEARVSKAMKKTSDIAEKYEKMGYKIDRTNDDTLNISLMKAAAKYYKDQQKAASAHIPTLSEKLEDYKKSQNMTRETHASGMPSYIPRMATGGIVSAPTLALVGDNTNAMANPEVVAPLSELERIMSGSDIVKCLQQIIVLLETLGFDIHTDIDGREVFRTVIKQNKLYKQRTGASAL